MPDDQAPPIDHGDIATLHQRIDSLRDEVKRELAKGESRMGDIEQSIAENTRITTDVHNLLNTFRTGMKVAGAVGRGAVWVRNVVLALLAMLGLYHAVIHGVEPPTHQK